MGGLTVLRALKEVLPQETFLYLGDMARVPYGTKTSETILRYTEVMAQTLIAQGIKALVIACNTATTAALPTLQRRWPELPIIGVIAPGAEAASRVTRNDRVLVWATERTIASEAYQATLRQHKPHLHIQNKVCSILVALAEAGMTHNNVAREALLHYLDGFDGEDTLLLGCTHFPVFTSLLSSLLPKDVQIVDSAVTTAETLKILLETQQLLRQEISEPNTYYLVTDAKERFQSVGAQFLGHGISADCIEVIDVGF